MRCLFCFTAVALQSDINKLQENNESIKHLCSDVTQEKMELQKEYDILTQKTIKIENEWKKLQGYMSDKFSLKSSDIEAWISAIDSKLESKIEVKTEEDSESKLRLLRESEKSNKMNLELQQALSNLTEAVSERNDLQVEIQKLEDTNRQLKSELDSLNEDKDKIMSNLENMRIETRQLIESSEKLSEEIEILKIDKSKTETELISALNEKNNLNLELSYRNNDITKLLEQVNVLRNEIDIKNSKIASFEKSFSQFAHIQENLNDQIELNKTLQGKIESLNVHINGSEEKINSCNTEIKRLVESLEKTQESETKLKNELKIAVENSVALQNKLKQIESDAQLNPSVTEALLEKDRYINHLRNDIESLKTKLENNDDSFSKQLESLRFEKEELKCLVDTLKEEATENTNKYTQELNEKQELLSQSLIREKKIFDEFKNNVVELQNNNEKLTFEYSEIEKYCNEKCLEVEKLTQEAMDGRKKIETLENDLSNMSSQFNDVTHLLSEASTLNQKFEKELKESQIKTDELLIENDKLKSDLDRAIVSVKELQSYREESIKQLETLNSDLNNIREDSKAKENQISELNKQLEAINSSHSDLKTKLEEASNELNSKQCELNNKNDNIIDLEKTISNLKAAVDDLESKLKASTDEIDSLKSVTTQRQENDGETSKIIADISLKYKEEISTLECSLRDRSAELDSCRRTWIGHLTILKGAFFGLKHSYEDLKKSVRDLQDFLTTLSSLTPVNFQVIQFR